MKILIIIPAYNEEANILQVCKKIKEYDKNLDYIVINDASTDNTLKICRENNLKHINLIHNLGIGGAVQTGYKYAYQNNYDIAIQFDGDGQHDETYIENLCKPIIEGKCNLCIGSRYLDDTTSGFKSTFMRRLGKNILSLILKITCHKKITDPTSGFRAADKQIIQLFASDYPTDYPEPESIVNILKQGYKVEEVPVNMKERTGGKSSIRVWKSAQYMIKVSLAIIISSISVRKIINKRREEKESCQKN